MHWFNCQLICNQFKGIVRSFGMFHWNQNSLKNTFLIMATYLYNFIAYKILYLTIYFVFKRRLINSSYYTETFLVGAYWFGASFPKQQTFSGMHWVLPIDYSLFEKAILGIFAYLFICKLTKTKVNFRF